MTPRIKQIAPVVGVALGDMADYAPMQEALDLFEEWGVGYEVAVLSSHHTPDHVASWAVGAEGRGLQTIIAAAGQNLHLPGALAAQTSLPVIGVPLDIGSPLAAETLYSVAEMTEGIPVAMVGINGAVNAAMLALQILARIDERWDDQLQNERERRRSELESQNDALRAERPGASIPDFTVAEDESEAEEADAGADVEMKTRAHVEEDEDWEEGEVEDADIRRMDFDRPLEPAPTTSAAPRKQAASASEARPRPSRSRPHKGLIRLEGDLMPFTIAERAVETLMQGGIVALPTDTVYGLAVDATNADAVERLYKVKGREPDRAIAVFIDSQRLLASLVRNLSIDVRHMLDAFWPGPLTVVFERRDRQYLHLTGDETIGVRLPDHNIPLTILQELRRPVACSSANPTGAPTAASGEEIADYFGEAVDLILDIGPLPERPPSTVVDVTDVPFQILREGAISRDQLAAVLGDLLEAEE